MDPSNEDRWADVEPYLVRALAEGGGKDWDLVHVKEAAAAGRVLVWGFFNAGALCGAGVTKILHYPRRRIMEVLLFASEPYAGFMGALDLLKNVARNLGASSIQGTGRRGWARQLRAKERLVWELEV